MSSNSINLENTGFWPPRVYVKSERKERKIFPVACIDYRKGRVDYHLCDCNDNLGSAPLRDCILLHPTGRKDRNGVEIYQDDRVKFRYDQEFGEDPVLEGVVEYSKQDADWWLLVQNEGTSLSMADPLIYHLEVIGSAAGED